MGVLPRVVLLLFVLAPLAGCGPARTYAGPARPRADTAVLRVWGTGSDVGSPGEARYRVWLRTLDGERYRGAKTILEVLPGPHVLELRWQKQVIPHWLGNDPGADRYDWHPIADGVVTVEVDAEAGMSYELDWPDDDRDVPAGPPSGFVPVPR